MDKTLFEEIISSAINIASGGRVESISHIAPDKMMTSEQVQQLDLTKEAIVEALLQDPRVASAECREGKFHVVTEEGAITFNFVFGYEGEGSRFVIEDEGARQEPVTAAEASIEETVQILFELVKEGVTVEDFIESSLKNPRVMSAEYKNGRFHFETTEGPINFWFPFLSSRSKEKKKEGNDESKA